MIFRCNYGKGFLYLYKNSGKNIIDELLAFKDKNRAVSQFLLKIVHKNGATNKQTVIYSKVSIQM